MKLNILIAAALAFATSVNAQDVPAVPRTTIQNNYLLLNIEAGPTLVGVGGIKIAGGSYNPTISSGVSVWPSLIARVMRITPTWNYGLRAEVTIWGDRDGIQHTNDKGDPLGKSTTYYAAPAISVAPAVGYRIFGTQKAELTLGAYVGFAFSAHKEDMKAMLSSTSLYTGSLDTYIRPSAGLQIGGELNYRYWLGQRWAVSASAGFQHNAMRYNDNRDYGFNLNTLPVTLGTSVRL